MNRWCQIRLACLLSLASIWLVYFSNESFGSVNKKQAERFYFERAERLSCLLPDCREVKSSCEYVICGAESLWDTLLSLTVFLEHFFIVTASLRIAFAAPAAIKGSRYPKHCVLFSFLNNDERKTLQPLHFTCGWGDFVYKGVFFATQSLFMNVCHVCLHADAPWALTRSRDQGPRPTSAHLPWIFCFISESGASVVTPQRPAPSKPSAGTLEWAPCPTWGSVSEGWVPALS